MQLYFDIESVPTQRQDVRDLIAATVTPPSTMSKPETIAKWEAENKPAAIERAIHGTGLSGTFGEVLCIAWAIDESEIHCAFRPDLKPESEASVLREFFKAVDSVWNHQDRTTFVGHYITGFDLRFLWQRAVVNQVKPSRHIPFTAKPWDTSVFDTCIQWAGAKGAISQDDLCRALRIPCKSGMDGSMVWDYVQQGKLQEVREYCIGDVQRVREIYRRMQFQTQLQLAAA